MKKIWIITLFPDYFTPLIKQGVISQAFRSIAEGGKGLNCQVLDLREYSIFNYRNVDDSPYGGGAGMVMRADILKRALEDVLVQGGYTDFSALDVFYPSPRGYVWTQEKCKKFAQEKLHGPKDLVFIAGRYEGIDERFIQKYVNELISVGDYILSGGELAIMTILDSSLRLLPGVLGNEQSILHESFEDNLLEEPLYTKPQEFEGMKVPEILLSGHHKNIEEYKSQERRRITCQYRPDLLKKSSL